MPIDTKTNRREPSPQQNYLSKILTFLFWLLILVNLVLFREPQHPQVPYSQFMAQVEADKVSRVVISSNQIQYELRSEVTAQVPNKQSPAKPKQIFVTIPVAMDLELPKLLREHKVEFSVLPPSNLNWLAVLLSWVMPPLIFLSIWGWLIGRNQLSSPATLTLGKTKARIYSEGSTGIKFNDVAGVDEAKAELQEIIDFLKYADKYVRLGAKIPKGVLLVGPPGTGKTLLARAIAGEAGVPFFSISGSAFIELFVGLGAARVRDLFEGFSNPRRQVSPTIAETIDREVKDLVDSAHEMALTILEKNQQLLEDTAQKLLAKEVLEGEELRDCLHQVQAPAEVDIWLHTGKLLKSALTAQSIYLE